jgi:hypothetical protein
MPFNQPEALRYFTFPSLSAHNLIHAVFTRQGGVSPAPWNSLNLGSTVGDHPEHVHANRQRAFNEIGCRYESLFDVWQVHSDVVVTADAPRHPERSHQQADAIITNSNDVTLMMRFADCVPILLYDPYREVIGLVHAGWLGTVRKVVCNAVTVMKEKYYSIPADIIAAIGPSIGPDHYLVGEDVIYQVKLAFGSDSSDLLKYDTALPAGKAFLNLWQANQQLLENAGIQHIETAGICTACNLMDWYSHRAENGRTGRFGVLLTLGRSE